MKYTKGKWEIGSDSWDTYIGAGNQYFAKIINSGSLTNEEIQANAHLIAAAPDMYETLEQARQDINWMLNNQQFLNPDRFAYIDKTLAKAEGKA